MKPYLVKSGKGRAFLKNKSNKRNLGLYLKVVQALRNKIWYFFSVLKPVKLDLYYQFL